MALEQEGAGWVEVPGRRRTRSGPTQFGQRCSWEKHNFQLWRMQLAEWGGGWNLEAGRGCSLASLTRAAGEAGFVSSLTAGRGQWPRWTEKGCRWNIVASCISVFLFRVVNPETRFIPRKFDDMSIMGFCWVIHLDWDWSLWVNICCFCNVHVGSFSRISFWMSSLSLILILNFISCTFDHQIIQTSAGDFIIDQERLQNFCQQGPALYARAWWPGQGHPRASEPDDLRWGRRHSLDEWPGEDEQGRPRGDVQARLHRHWWEDCQDNDREAGEVDI